MEASCLVFANSYLIFKSIRHEWAPWAFRSSPLLLEAAMLYHHKSVSILELLWLFSPTTPAEESSCGTASTGYWSACKAVVLNILCNLIFVRFFVGITAKEHFKEGSEREQRGNFINTNSYGQSSQVWVVTKEKACRSMFENLMSCGWDLGSWANGKWKPIFW